MPAKPRFGLVEPCETGEAKLDIRFRMLQPHELAAAMSYDGYEFTGTKEEQVRQIGNGVARRTAEALCKSILTQRKVGLNMSRETGVKYIIPKRNMQLL